MKITQVKLLVVAEVDDLTTLLLSQDLNAKVKVDPSSDDVLVVSNGLAEDGVHIKGKAFVFPASKLGHQAVIYYDGELKQIVARFAFFQEGNALLRAAAGNDAPEKLIELFDEFLNKIRDLVKPEVEEDFPDDDA